MHRAEIKAIMDSAIILVDTREQLNPRFKVRVNDLNMPWEQVKIDEGDYSIKALLPDGTEVNLIDSVGIERKKDLNELASCFGSGRDRFLREVKRAQAKGKKLYLLVENAQIDYLMSDVLYKEHCQSLMNRKALLHSVISWSIKYGFQPWFCKDRNSGELIASILKKELECYLQNLIDAEEEGENGLDSD